MYFLMVLEAGKFKIMVLVDLVSSESTLPGLYIAVFSLSSYGLSKVHEQDERGPLFLFLQGQPSYSIRAPPL